MDNNPENQPASPPEAAPVPVAICPMEGRAASGTGGLYKSVRELLAGVAHDADQQPAGIHSLAPLFSDDECLVAMVSPEDVDGLVDEASKRGLLCERLDQLVGIHEIPDGNAPGVSLQDADDGETDPSDESSTPAPSHAPSRDDAVPPSQETN